MPEPIRSAPARGCVLCGGPQSTHRAGRVVHPDGLVARMYRSTRTIGITLACVGALAAGLVVTPAAAHASAAGRAATTSVQSTRIVGGTGSCTRARGAMVAVSFRRWHGPVVRGCGLHAANGIRLLKRAGFTVRGTRQSGLAFVCRIGSPRFHHGRRYPTPAQDPCVRTPPPNAYWSYWVARRGQDRWRFSRLGATAHHPKPGEAEAWVFGAGRRPGFAPHQVRAGLHSATVTVAAATSARPDLGAATRYLTDSANLVDGTRYDTPGTKITDFGVTMDAAMALAASGTADDALREVTRYVFANADRYSGVGTRYASGGAIGKEALLAEITGADPHNINGHDLIAALNALVCGRSASNSCAGSGNYRYAQSTFSQALGVIAQLRAGDTSGAARPVAYLERLQNRAGAFPSVLPGTDSDVDSTAAAAMALALAGNRAAHRAVARALAWIAAQQHADGSFTGAAGHSTNSTGLAVQALSLTGSRYRDAINRADAFLAREQNPDGGFAVATGTHASDLRATAQVVSGVTGTSLGTLSADLGSAQPALHRRRAVHFLVSSLTHGTHLRLAGGKGPNYGGTADLAVALAAAGGHDRTLRAVLRYLINHVDGYVDPRGKQSFPGPFTGAAAKLAVLAEITGRRPRAFGGVNLMHLLISHVCTRAKGGQFGPCSAKGDFYQVFSTVGQALGVLALARAHVAVPRAAVHRLIGLQCANGGFSSTLLTGSSRCRSDVDSTGFAIQALTRVPSAKSHVLHAVAFLRTRQRDNGGWAGASGVNTNSTALAIQGLLASGRNTAAVHTAVRRGLRFLARRQNGNGGFGISAANPKSDVLATTQAVPAIYRATLSRLSHPVRFDPSGGGSTGLANTGSPTGPLLDIGAALIVVGSVLTAFARRTAQGQRH